MRADEKLHVVVETQRAPQRGDAYKLGACRREASRQRSALAQLAMQFFGGSGGGTSSSSGGTSGARAVRPGASSTPSSLENLTQTARQLVQADDMLSSLQGAQLQKSNIGRMLDVNERQQQQIVQSIQNAKARFGRATQLLRGRLRVVGPASEAATSIRQTYASTLGMAQQQMASLRQQLQSLRQQRIELDSQFDQTRKDMEELEMAQRQRAEAAQRLAPAPAPPPPLAQRRRIRRIRRRQKRQPPKFRKKTRI